ncbi:GIY-YIG nuclease family protein [Flagellimonas sp. HMM57]|uniref:GIY-YIG nuclease family protein n=1 Tax=unclassified Flagellimonas TaxID=2644544 RepID=UPI0013D82A38|nr:MULTISPECIES: GIY-YIG nuclease family protein [unclassified Flagellimonas]UII77360.1 GIY-YIG nuclease family protein [Flagellimonas sp. HMM57]
MQSIHHNGPVVQWIAPIAIGGSFKYQHIKMHYVYIIQSKIDNGFYVGETRDLVDRLTRHNTKELNAGITNRKIPWDYFYILKVKNSTVARKIERHIKKMKSRAYIENLRKYPEIATKLIEKYS